MWYIAVIRKGTKISKQIVRIYQRDGKLDNDIEDASINDVINLIYKQSGLDVFH